MQDGRNHLALLLIPWSGDVLRDTENKNKARQGARQKDQRRKPKDAGERWEEIKTEKKAKGEEERSW